MEKLLSKWGFAFALSTVFFSSVAGIVLYRTQHNAQLELEVEWKESRFTTLQVFWAADGQEFPEENSLKQTQAPGKFSYPVSIPLYARKIRIDPGELPGRLILHSMVLRFLGVSLVSWNTRESWSDVNRGFFLARENLKSMTVTDSGLAMESNGVDPQLVLFLSKPLKTQTGRIMVVVSLALGLAFSILQILVASGTQWAIARLRRVSWNEFFKGLALFTASSALGTVGIYFAYHYLITKRPPQPSIADRAGYEETIVDRRGRSLFGKPGAVMLALDPFTQYRNLPSQRNVLFTVDAQGYRGTSEKTSPKNRAVILGGSSVFGVGVGSDDDTLSAQLNRSQDEFQFFNAGVISSLSGQALSEMVHHSDELHPTLYVVYNGWNDVLGQYDIRDRSHMFGASPIAYEIEKRLSDSYKPASPTAHALMARAADPELSESETYDRIFGAYLVNIERMEAFARARGAKFVAILEPHLWAKKVRSAEEVKYLSNAKRFFRGDFEAVSAKLSELQAIARSEFKKKGIEYIDLQSSGPFRDSRESLFTDMIHPNARGNQTIAQAIKSWMQKTLPAKVAIISNH